MQLICNEKNKEKFLTNYKEKFIDKNILIRKKIWYPKSSENDLDHT